MKKLFAIVLAVAMFASMATVASAAENTTTLTTTVPAASYTLNIPADQEISFGATSTEIGTITISESNGFAVGKNVAVTVSYDAFKSEDVATTIPFTLWRETKEISTASPVQVASGDVLTFKGKSDGTATEKAEAEFTWSAAAGGGGKANYSIDNLDLRINSKDWGKALGGEYTATITFTAEVVAG